MKSFLIALAVVIAVSIVIGILLPLPRDPDVPPHAERLTGAHRVIPGESPGSSLEGIEKPVMWIRTVNANTAAALAQNVVVVVREPTRVADRPSTRGDYPAPGSPTTTAVSAWDTQAMCETGGNWHMQGSRYSGGLGFLNSTWDAYGGRQFAPNAGLATREQQIVIAERIQPSPPSTPGHCRGW